MKNSTKAEPMRVCMVVHQNYFDDARVRRYCEALAAEGAFIDVLCIADAARSNTKAMNNITVHTIPVDKDYQSKADFLLGYIHAFFLYFFKLTILHFRHRFSVVHIHNMPDFLVFTALIPRILGTPVILDIHDIMPEFFVSKFGIQPDHYMVKVIRFQEKLSTMFANAVITACRGFQRKLVNRGLPEKKLLVIYNTPNTGFFNREKFKEIRSAKRSRFTLIFPGTQAPRYGLDIPIRAMPELARKIENVHLQIIGWQNDYTRELQVLAEELGVTNRVEFIPAVPVDKVPELLSAADLGIYPAIRDQYMDVAVPEKVFEYSLMRLPIVATRLTVLEEMFSDKAILYFESNQLDQFIARVMEIYTNSELAEELMTQADLEYSQEFSWVKGRLDYFRLLDGLTGKRHKLCP